MPTMIERREAAYQDALTRMDEAQAAIDGAEDGADLDALQAEFDEAVAEVERTRGNLDEAERINQAAQRHRDNIPEAHAEETGGESRGGARVGREEPVYRRDTQGFLQDVVAAYRGSIRAQERLERHNQQMADNGVDIQRRDVTTADPGAAGFVPPIYMSELWAELPRADRPFADAARKMPLPPTGMTVSIPKVQSGVTVAAQATENSAVSETDADSQTVSVPVRTIAGMNDMSLQAFERTAPGFDMVVAEDLRAAYDAELDRQLSQGTGASGQHLGIRAVSGVNTVAYADASPTAAELHPKLYDAIQKIASVRFKQATHLIMHPRRSAWIASNLSTTFPLLQQGGLYQAVGTQDGGFAKIIAGLPVIDDANVGTLLGAGTEDEIYAVYMPDFILMEDAPRFEVFRDVLSGTGEARLRLWAYSAWASARQAAAISVISGTGLIAPTF